MGFEGALVTLIVFAIVLGIGAAAEQATRPKPELHADDWRGEGNVR